MEAILSNYDNDEKSRQMEELIQANHELLEQNEKLKQEIDDMEVKSMKNTEPLIATSSSMRRNFAPPDDKMQADLVIELNEQIDEVKQECEKLKVQLKLVNEGEALSKKEI